MRTMFGVGLRLRDLLSFLKEGSPGEQLRLQCEANLQFLRLMEMQQAHNQAASTAAPISGSTCGSVGPLQEGPPNHDDAASPARAVPAVVASDSLVRRGRPRIGDEGSTLKARAPWVAAGMSERTWYRRRKEARG